MHRPETPRDRAVVGGRQAAHIAVSEEWREAGQHWKHVATRVATQIKSKPHSGLSMLANDC